MSRTLEAALAYADQLGIAVFPVIYRNGKMQPVSEHGVKDAATDPDQIRHLWRPHPSAGVAGAMGLRSRLIGLDVDLKPEKDGKSGVDGFASLGRLEAEHGILPTTWRARTPSGGAHLYFRQPDRPFRNKVGLTIGHGAERVSYPGLDIRADGGSLTLPPTEKESGAYVWTAHPLSTPLADLPAWLERIIDPPPAPRPAQPPLRLANLDRTARYVEAALDGECSAVASMGRNTGRNLRLFQASANLFQLVAAGVLPEQLAEDRLEAAAHDCGLVQEDGWHAVRQTIASGKRRGMQNPREIAS